MNEKIDYAEIKARYALRPTVERYLGERLKQRRSKYDAYLCPFHNDRNASFVVYETGCGCEAGCSINGRAWGDLYDFLIELLHFRNSREVVQELTGKIPTPPVLPELPKSLPERKISWRDVKRGQRYTREARSYFTRRGVPLESVTKHQMGGIDWRFQQTVAGEDHHFSARRYTIPDIAFGVLRNIELRLDEEDAERQLSMLDQGLVRAAINEVGTGKDLLYYLFGAKYLRVPGGVHKNLVFNCDSVIQRIEYQGIKGWFCPEIPYVFIHEGALKALVVEGAGYPSVSSKGAIGLAAWIGVKHFFVVQDNEPDQQRPDGTIFNAGRTYALRNAEATGRRPGQGVSIVLPPAGCKAGDDIVQAGMIDDWVKDLCAGI